MFLASLPYAQELEFDMPENKNASKISGGKIFEAKDLGQLIKVRRKELGYTQEYLAMAMGISPRLIGEIEKGKKTVGIQKVLNLAINLGIDLTASVRGSS